MIFFTNVFKNIWFTAILNFPGEHPRLDQMGVPAPPLRRGISYYKEGDEYGELPLMYTSTLTWKPSCHTQFVSVETVMLWCRSNSQFVFNGGVYSLRSRHMSDHLFMSLGTFH